MSKPIDLTAVYTGDSPNYHIFQVVDSGDFVGSLYIKKSSDNGIPETIEVNFVTPSRDKVVWKKGMDDLLDKAREGSKAEKKLIRTMRQHD